jgi:hypothetical protein
VDDIVAAVERSLAPETRDRFERRVESGADFLRDRIESGDLDAPDFAVGLEVEAYAVDGHGRLAPLPGAVFEAGASKELGVHNAELNTPATRFDAAGLAAQGAALRERIESVQRAASEADRRLVLDAMWTRPPAGGSVDYLSAAERRDGVTLATNMRPSPRYHAIDNAVIDWAGGTIPLRLPGVDRAFPTILFESLTTSIQPHLQVPSVGAYPRYLNAAIRTTGPLLALTANSPFLPADCYATDDPYGVVEATPHECRIPVFESAINVDDGRSKVRFPRDIDRATDVVDRIVADRLCAPFLREWVQGDGSDGSFVDAFWELDHKRGTYWRWVRSVIGGDPVDGAGDGRSIRVEYRPLPTQPSAADTVAILHLTAGLLRGLVAADHPIVDLPWSDARDAFYAAVDEGSDARPAWVTADGDRTTDPERVFDEVFRYARRGLRAGGLSASTIDERLAPVEHRAARLGGDAPVTPSAWKKRRVRGALDDGASLPEAIRRMQAAYAEREGTPFVEWQ